MKVIGGLGVVYRISQDSYAAFDTVQTDSSRIVIVPIIDSFDVNGRKTILVDGFAVFFLEGSNGGVVTRNFMRICSNKIAPDTGQDFDLYNVKLISKVN